MVFIVSFRLARGIQADPVFKKLGNRHPLLPRVEKAQARTATKARITYLYVFLTLVYS